MIEANLVQVTVNIQYHKFTLATKEWFLNSSLFDLVIGPAEDIIYGLNFTFLGSDSWPSQPSLLGSDFKNFGRGSFTDRDLEIILDEADARFQDLKGLGWISRHEHMTPVPGFWPVNLLVAFEVEEIEYPGEFHETGRTTLVTRLLGFVNQRQARKRRLDSGIAELGLSITVPGDM